MSAPVLQQLGIPYATPLTMPAQRTQPQVVVRTPRHCPSCHRHTVGPRATHLVTYLTATGTLRGETRVSDLDAHLARQTRLGWTVAHRDEQAGTAYLVRDRDGHTQTIGPRDTGTRR